MEQLSFENDSYNKAIKHQDDITGLGFSSDNDLEHEIFVEKKVQEGNKQNIEANLLKKCLEYEITDEDFLKLLKEYGVTKDDFDIKKVDDRMIIISKSSYFSSIVGLNGEEEKFNSRNSKDRSEYDKFDAEISRLFTFGITKEQFKADLVAYCKENNVNLNSELITMGGGCVIPEGNFIGIKKFPWDSLEITEKDKLIIAHENQHVKFNKYCEENGIEKNGYLKILDEVIAHCLNTKDEDGNIDFKGIRTSMESNTNYFSGFNEKDYLGILPNIIYEVENELNKSKKLDDTMEILIEEYKDKNCG